MCFPVTLLSDFGSKYIVVFDDVCEDPQRFARIFFNRI